jgi:hypothetical protein
MLNSPFGSLAANRLRTVEASTPLSRLGKTVAPGFDGCGRASVAPLWAKRAAHAGARQAIEEEDE